MKKEQALMCALALLAGIASAPAHERAWPAKRLQTAWPEADDYVSRQIGLSASQIAHLEKEAVRVGVEDRSPTFYFARKKKPGSDKERTEGVIVFVDEYGANGKMEISVAMEENGAVRRVHLWQHAENKAIESESFLKQFVGKSHGDSFEPEKGYKPVAEAKDASAAVARAVRKALAITESVFGKK